MRANDSISDFLTRVRNAQKAGHDVVSIPASKIKIAIAHLMREEGFIKDYKCIRDRRQGILKLALKYDERGVGVMTQISRVSSPGRRVYLPYDKLPFIRNGFGVGVLSTSQGVLTDRDARRLKLGGEYLCTIY